MYHPLLAHSAGGHGWGGPIEPWELHPALSHLPIAFLLGGVALDLYARWRCRPDLFRTSTGLLVAGVLTGTVTALAGVLAYFTVPAHTALAHHLMYWHMGVQAAALTLFAGLSFARWRGRGAPPGKATGVVGVAAASLLVVGSGIGGYLVYHGGAGVAPELLAAEVRGGHSHGGEPDKRPADEPPLPGAPPGHDKTHERHGRP